MDACPYLEKIHSTLPRILGLFDWDRTSRSHGLGDRSYWAWAVKDFGNATFQGAAHGFSRLWKAGLWPYETPEDVFVARLDAIRRGAARLRRRNGSVEEAFPYEGSYCVTALVAFDLLCALELMGGDLDADVRRRWTDTLEPMLGYLVTADETHGLISNHLATAAAALARWSDLTGDPSSEARAHELVDRILDHQSSEGWFAEYEGADPGYQSLCTYYLADLRQRRAGWGLTGALGESVRFLWHFAHPDGSFGGVYGSRSTRFFCPAGIEALAGNVPEAAALASFMRESIRNQTTVTLDCLDEPGLIPMFNAYCWAAVLARESKDASPGTDAQVPCTRSRPGRRYFREAGLLIDGGPSHYTVVSVNKGGTIDHFEQGRAPRRDPGVVVRGPGGKLGSTQALTEDNGVSILDDTVVVESRVAGMSKRLPRPAEFLALRILGMTLFRWQPLREAGKRFIARRLISRGDPWPVKNVRRIRLGPGLRVGDQTDCPAGFRVLEDPGDFVAIHMAGKGYWQVQDEGGRVAGSGEVDEIGAR